MHPPFAVHDLLQLQPDSLRNTSDLPTWLTPRLSLWCVVRRPRSTDGTIPVGFRGLQRDHRFATCIPPAQVRQILKPEALRIPRHPAPHLATHHQALTHIASLLHNDSWGPGGSLGFEFATAIPTVTPTSDLDIILRRPTPPTLSEARQLLHHLDLLPIPTDVLIELPHAGFSLRDYAQGQSFVLRTSTGPILCTSAANIASTLEQAA